MSEYITLYISSDCQLYLTQAHHGHDGKTRYASQSIERAKGMGLGHVHELGSVASHKSITLPCATGTLARIRDFVGMQQQMGEVSEQWGSLRFREYGPYYFTMTMEGDRGFEKRHDPVHLIGGPDTAYAYKFRQGLLTKMFANRPRDEDDPFECHNNAEGLPYARYNCWTATQGITQYVAGIDLAQIAPNFPFHHRARQAMKENGALIKNLEKTAHGHGDGKYDILHEGDFFTLARRIGHPPFIHWHKCDDGLYENYRLHTLLNEPIGNTKKTLAQICDEYDKFTPQLISAHHHSHNKPLAARLPKVF